jgi:tRNA threonylcarbamoyladenosine biosynthesis protein TsaE
MANHDTIIESEQEMLKFAKSIGSSLKKGDLIALIGELGAGKTVFVKGLVEAIAKSKTPSVSSPTFTLINEYKADVPLYHFDCYRLKNVNELEMLGFYDYLSGKGGMDLGVVAVEWADRVPEILEHASIVVNIEYLDEKRRKVTVAQGFSPAL